MEKLIVTIAKGNETYGAWIDCIPGVYGQGDTVEEAKNELEAGMKLYIKYNTEIPDILQKEFEFEYRFDVASFLDYYSKIFSKTALEHLTGINQKQLFHYASGHRRPSEKTVKKIDTAFRRFSNELNQVHFV
jgi:predicted RNase H-like HicB family nuclease